MSIQKDSWFHSDKGIKDFWTSWTAWHCEGFWNLKKKEKKTTKNETNHGTCLGALPERASSVERPRVMWQLCMTFKKKQMWR